MAKDCIKTIRLSQEDLDFIESQPGSTFSQKFDGLIALMRDEVPAKQAELEQLQRLLQKKRSSLSKYESDIYSISKMISSASRLQISLAQLVDSCDKLLNGAVEND